MTTKVLYARSPRLYLVQKNEELKPRPLVLSILWTLTAIIPTWKIMPTQDLLEVAIKDPNKRTEVRNFDMISFLSAISNVYTIA